MAVMTKEEFAQHVKSDTLPMYRLAYSILQNSADAEDAALMAQCVIAWIVAYAVYLLLGMVM